jgi:hypothetical protein
MGPALSHIASTLDTLMRSALVKSDRADLVRHRPTKTSAVMDHFDALELRLAMVFRPIWFAYRPYETPAQRAVSHSFARHAVAHVFTARQVVSHRNVVQAAMLTAASKAEMNSSTRTRFQGGTPPNGPGQGFSSGDEKSICESFGSLWAFWPSAVAAVPVTIAAAAHSKDRVVDLATLNRFIINPLIV